MSRFEVLADQVAAVLDVDKAIIDGEVIVADETGRPQFYDLVRRIRAPAYVAFDIPWLDAFSRSLLSTGRSMMDAAIRVAGLVGALSSDFLA